MAPSLEQRRILERWAKSRQLPFAQVVRARLVLMLADGMKVTHVARKLGITAPTVRLWRQRFEGGGVDSLAREAPRTGRRPTLTSGQARSVLERTLGSRPPNGMRWTVRSMAGAIGMSRMTVCRLWNRCHIEPPNEVWKASYGTQGEVRVAVVVGLDGGFGRAVARGIKEHAPESWALHYVLPQTVSARGLTEWRPNGIIADLMSREVANGLTTLGLPMVNISGILDRARIPRVGVDDDEVGRLAAEHLLERAFLHFAYFGHSGEAFSRLREKGFARALSLAGCHYARFDEGRRTDVSWAEADARLTSWLLALPKPVALFACNDARAWHASAVARKAGLSVPDDVAVLGVDDDELFCRIADPPLSSIAIPAVRIGRTAAECLERMLGGQSPGALRLLLPPDGVVARRSSDVVAVADPRVRSALQMIRARGADRLSVAELAQRVGVSRRVLERLFRATLGRSPLQDMRRAGIERARALLAQPGRTVAEAAELAGFASPEDFARVFRGVVGMSPSAYRKRCDAHSPG